MKSNPEESTESVESWVLGPKVVINTLGLKNPAAITHTQPLAVGIIEVAEDGDFVGKICGGALDLANNARASGDVLVSFNQYGELIRALGMANGLTGLVIPRARRLAEFTAHAMNVHVSDLRMASVVSVSPNDRVNNVVLHVLLDPSMARTIDSPPLEVTDEYPHNANMEELMGVRITGWPCLTQLCPPRQGTDAQTLMYADLSIVSTSNAAVITRHADFYPDYASLSYAAEHALPADICERVITYASLETRDEDKVTVKHRFNASLSATRDALIEYFVSQGYWSAFRTLKPESAEAVSDAGLNGKRILCLETKILRSDEGRARLVRVALVSKHSNVAEDAGLYAYLDFLNKHTVSEGGSRYRALTRLEFQAYGINPQNMTVDKNGSSSEIKLRRTFHQQFNYTAPRLALRSQSDQVECDWFQGMDDITRLIIDLGVQGEYLQVHVEEVMSMAKLRQSELNGTIYISLRAEYSNARTLSGYTIIGEVDHRNIPQKEDHKECAMAADATHKDVDVSYYTRPVFEVPISRIRSPEIVFDNPIIFPENTSTLRPYSGVYTGDLEVAGVLADLRAAGVDLTSSSEKLQNHACDMRERYPRLVLGALRVRVLFTNSKEPGDDERIASIMFYYEAHESPLEGPQVPHDEQEASPTHVYLPDAPDGRSHSVLPVNVDLDSPVGDARTPERAEQDRIAERIIDDVIAESKAEQAAQLAETIRVNEAARDRRLRAHILGHEILILQNEKCQAAIDVYKAERVLAEKQQEYLDMESELETLIEKLADMME